MKVESIVCVHSADMQFQGQSHILSVALPSAAVSVEALRELFEAAYWKRFAVELKEIRPVLVNLHTAVIGKRRPVPLAALGAGLPCESLPEAETGRRAVWFEARDGAGSGGSWIDTPVYRRDWLPARCAFEGPAIVEQLDATTLIEPGNRVEKDAMGNLIVRV